MNIRKAKKLLKNAKCHVRPDRNLYTKVSWLHKRKIFRVISYWGQTGLISDIKLKHEYGK